MIGMLKVAFQSYKQGFDYLSLKNREVWVLF
jgi:hypothetical protein